MLTWKHLLQICWPYIYDPNLPASHPKGALLKWYLVAVEAILKQWSHRHVQETSLSWFELCDRGSHWKMTKEDNTQAGCNLKQYWVGTKRPCSRKTSHTSLYHLQHKLLTQGRMDLFFHVVDSNIKKKKIRLMRPGTSSSLLSSFGEPLWTVASVFCSQRKGATWCLLLLYPIRRFSSLYHPNLIFFIVKTKNSCTFSYMDSFKKCLSS